MHRTPLRLWFPAFAALALSLVALSCGSASSDAVQSATQDDTPTPSLGAHLVQHEPAEVAPQVAWRSSAIERSPMSLTAGDGSGLRLLSITGTVVIEDPLAFTELRLTFENPEARRREGRFEFDLPPQAALSRLAMHIGSQWVEGEVVERTQGQRTFESLIHQRPKVDPALLEKAAANRVSARVFPILPLEQKEIIVSYSQQLAGRDAAYRLPLQGLPTLDALDVRVIVRTSEPAADRDSGVAARFVGAQRIVEVRERDFAPDKDLVIALQGAGDAAGMRTDELVAVRVRPTPSDTHDAIDSLTILFDTSASAARSFDGEVDRLGALLQTLGTTPTRIVAFDQTRELIFDGPARDALGDPLAGLRERRAFGASDLHAALTDPAVTTASSRRLLIWSDGMATAGATERVALADAAGAIPVDRIDAYATTTAADREALAGLTTMGPRTGFVVGPDLPGDAVVESLTHVGFDDVTVAVPGATWSYPRSLAGFSPGDDVIVYAGYEQGAPTAVHVAFSDPRLGEHIIPTFDAQSPLVERAVATARVAELAEALAAATEPAQAASLRQRLVRLSVKHRILTQHTALLVLENEAEYRRYGIDRAALADILTVGPAGVALLRRDAGPTGTVLPRVADLLADAPEPDARAITGNEGLLGMAQASGHFLAGPHGGAFAVGNDDQDVWGGLAGTEIGESMGAAGLGLNGVGASTRHRGEEGKMGVPTPRSESAGSEFADVGGLGLQGTGRGGGGWGEGTIGLGDLGLVGKGGSGSGQGGAGSGNGYGRGAGAGLGHRGMMAPTVRQAKPTVLGALDPDILRRIVRAHINEVRHCYNQGLVRDATLAGRVDIDFAIASTGTVTSATVNHDSLADPSVSECVVRAVGRWRFPAPAGGGTVTVSYPFLFANGTATAAPGPALARAARAATPRRRRGDPSDGPQWVGTAQSGRFAALQQLVAHGRTADARTEAWAWATTEPDNALALVALGEMLELEGRPRLAARVYGSLIDLHPHRADMRRAAGARLEALGASWRPLAVDTYRKAVDQRPDQLNGPRLLAWALVKDGAYEDAFEVLTAALETPVPTGRFNGVRALLDQDRELLAAAWLASEPSTHASVTARLRAAGVRPATTASLRLVADWETDATDVDLLVDPMGRGDGRRHADVRDGFGPEAWISRGKQRPAAVSARVRYFDRGAMGYAMGTVSAISHDGQGNLSFIDRPFVLMEAVGSVELGRFAS